MGIMMIKCLDCRAPFMWFTGNADQRCASCRSHADQRRNTFKEGDRVKYIGRDPTYHEPRWMGKLGTVQRPGVSYSNDTVPVLFDGEGTIPKNVFPANIERLYVEVNVPYQYKSARLQDVYNDIADQTQWTKHAGQRAQNDDMYVSAQEAANAAAQEAAFQPQRRYVGSSDGFSAWATNVRTKALFERCRNAERETARNREALNEEVQKRARLEGDIERIAREREEYCAGYATQRARVEELESQLAQKERLIELIRKVSAKRYKRIDDLQRRLEAVSQCSINRLAQIARLESERKVNGDFIELQAGRLTKARLTIAQLGAALRNLLALFGKPHKEEYVDGGASYELACKTVADAREVLTVCGLSDQEGK